MGDFFARYLMVEPDPRNCQEIMKRVGVSYPVSLILGGVSDEIGMKRFWHSFNTKDKTHASGSFRKPTGHVAAIPEVYFALTSMQQCYTLDWIFRTEELWKIDLLWADIQGSERDMIAGGQHALKHTRYLFMEVEQQEMYEGEALKHELIAMLPGWSVMREFEFNVLMRNEEFGK